MMNNFTPRAQEVLALARKEAERFHHNYVGTEHLLLGLIKLGQGVAVNVLQKMGLDLERTPVARTDQTWRGRSSQCAAKDGAQSGDGSHAGRKACRSASRDKDGREHSVHAPSQKGIGILAGKEAKALNHSYVGTEHILLGLLREGEGTAARVFKSLEVDPARTRNEILKELDPNFTPPESEAESSQEGDKKNSRRPPCARSAAI